MEDTNAFSALNQLILPNSISPSKMQLPMDDQMLKLLQGLPGLQMLNDLQTNPMMIKTENNENQQKFEEDEEGEKASPSNDSESLRQTVSPEIDENSTNISNGGTMTINNFGTNIKSNNQRNEGWYECFTTTSKSEYDALIYSLYVIDKDERKMDGWQYFECLNRLQNKCRYKVRCKKQDEFYIFEEKCGHNHGIEPVGQAGSHAGLPKTLREIVDRSFNESWSQEDRSAKIEEEIRRLGLPPNPRLGRQIDNRVAYLRRVKNLNETKKIQDQLAPNIDSNIFNSQMLQMLMDQNGGSLTVEKDIVDQLMNCQQSIKTKENVGEEGENEEEEEEEEGNEEENQKNQKMPILNENCDENKKEENEAFPNVFEELIRQQKIFNERQLQILVETERAEEPSPSISP